MFSTVCELTVSENAYKKQWLESINEAMLYVGNSRNPAKLLSTSRWAARPSLIGNRIISTLHYVSCTNLAIAGQPESPFSFIEVKPENNGRIIMAIRIALKHKETGIVKDGFYGFSWTTLFFGFFPALFRGDFITFIGGFVISVIVAFVTFGIGAFFIGLIWAFMYNKYYTRKLLERGYVFDGSDGDNALAASALGVVTSPVTA